MKKGQVTPFIIVGILLVILVVVVIVFIKPVQVGGRLSSTQVQPIRNYIEEDCIKSRLNDVLSDMREHGGYLLLDLDVNFETDDYLPNGEEYIRYVCCGSDYKPRRNNEKIEEDINGNIKKYLIDKCELDIFEDEFNIGKPKSSDININTSLNNKIVLLNVEFPVVVRKGIHSIKLDDFSVSVNNDIAKINEIVGKVVDKKIAREDIFTVNSEYGGVMGNCDDIPIANGCILHDAGGYYHILTRYTIDNDVGPFKFAIK